MELNLHRVHGKSDWADVEPQTWNVWQRIANSTHGVLTPANLVTALGGAVSLSGVGFILGNQWWTAIILLIVGRLLDIVDGMVADKTGTKSALGELLDAMVDKIVTVLTVAGLFVASVAPTWLLGLFILPHIIIVLITFVDRYNGIKLHPSRLGKTTMLLAWVAIPLLLLVKALGLHATNPFAVVVFLFVVVCIAFGFITATSYLTHPQTTVNEEDKPTPPSGA